MIGRYLQEVVRFAVRGVAHWVGFIQGLLALAAPMVLWPLGFDMPEGEKDMLLAWGGYALAAFVLMRLVTAPYFIWRADKRKIEDLNAKLQEERDAEKRAFISIDASRRVDAVEKLRNVIQINQETHYSRTIQSVLDRRRSLTEAVRAMDVYIFDDPILSALADAIRWHAKRRMCVDLLHRSSVGQEVRQHMIRIGEASSKYIGDVARLAILRLRYAEKNYESWVEAIERGRDLGFKDSLGDVRSWTLKRTDDGVEIILEGETDVLFSGLLKKADLDAEGLDYETLHTVWTE